MKTPDSGPPSPSHLPALVHPSSFILHPSEERCAMTRRHLLLLGLFASLCVVSPARSAEDDTVKDELAALKNANLDTDSKSLVTYIKKRTVSEELRTKIADAIRNLSAEEFDDREKASKALIEIGGPARPQL